MSINPRSQSLQIESAVRLELSDRAVESIGRDANPEAGPRCVEYPNQQSAWPNPMSRITAAIQPRMSMGTGQADGRVAGEEKMRTRCDNENVIYYERDGQFAIDIIRL